MFSDIAKQTYYISVLPRFSCLAQDLLFVDAISLPGPLLSSCAPIAEIVSPTPSSPVISLWELLKVKTNLGSSLRIFSFVFLWLFCCFLCFLCSTIWGGLFLINCRNLVILLKARLNSDLAAIPFRGRHLASSHAVRAKTYIKYYHTNKWRTDAINPNL